MTKIALLGAAGQIGTPLSLLCKASNLFTEIALYDLVHTPGIATDLNHIDTKATVSGFLPADDGLAKALSGADIVVVTAGIARKPGMTRDDLFNTNASIIRDIFTQVAKTCPKAISCIITNPVNSTVPVAAETLRTAGVFEPARLFGVTTLDVVRASTFAAHALGGDADPTSIKVPVIGGHSGATILPLYSQAQPPIDLGAELPNVINRVQFGGDEIVKSKQGAGSATTCMAYAGFRFVKALLTASSGTLIIEEAYVYLPGISGGKEISTQLQVDYFSVKVKLGGQGAREVLPIGNLSDDERILLEKAVEELRVNIQTGLSFVAGK
ncbi:Lactate dehydrogenase/glycoside hydrolase, family 4, C-terminal [Fusarium oxysporum f. sp. vasinfectum]|uniref:malate dehydrogenase n=1 Tax=Fusarium oxysporum f. sp. vasinfectum 25433 TaxID=1089449 RepID=X0MI76_FUSOX|nr:malate dehydrogenase, NAD-dependent [Fusarium oxysporum f. sp. vasinfectum 25433]KAK2676932.1 Lactate dehydrogenase/glycoside hydrolase, family 4, C-terminal [Fusarium oxysporum f. sp. vasinfectum]KAK2939641.1 Lactate dehydrogenase/glycoside hydrolase, family 4, C-terminal [Fusarium oxysporum f. sp. vasinfectum]